MSKYDDAIRTNLEERYLTGERPTQQDYHAIFTAIQEGIEEHEHTPSGGADSGTGDASPVAFLAFGVDTEKANTPQQGQVYISTDTTQVFVCFVAGTWTEVFGP